jgi:hypothetical protein
LGEDEIFTVVGWTQVLELRHLRRQTLGGAGRGLELRKSTRIKKSMLFE